MGQATALPPFCSSEFLFKQESCSLTFVLIALAPFPTLYLFYSVPICRIALALFRVNCSRLLHTHFSNYLLLMFIVLVPFLRTMNHHLIAGQIYSTIICRDQCLLQLIAAFVNRCYASPHKCAGPLHHRLL